MEMPIIADDPEPAERESEPAIETETAEPIEDETDDDDPDVVEVELGDDDLTADNGLFSGTEDAAGLDGDDSNESANPFAALDNQGGALEDAINDGAARLAVVGLDDDDKDELGDEIHDVMEAFRLGYFGAEFTQEYIFVHEDEAIDPAWGLLGSAVACTAVVLWMRPDGDQQVAKVRDAVASIEGGA